MWNFWHLALESCECNSSRHKDNRIFFLWQAEAARRGRCPQGTVGNLCLKSLSSNGMSPCFLAEHPSLPIKRIAYGWICAENFVIQVWTGSESLRWPCQGLSLTIMNMGSQSFDTSNRSLYIVYVNPDKVSIEISFRA